MAEPSPTSSQRPKPSTSPGRAWACTTSTIPMSATGIGISTFGLIFSPMKRSENVPLKSGAE
jgi:hypothetical protein